MSSNLKKIRKPSQTTIIKLDTTEMSMDRKPQHTKANNQRENGCHTKHVTTNPICIVFTLEHKKLLATVDHGS